MNVFSTNPLLLGGAMLGMIVVIFLIAIGVLWAGRIKASKTGEFDLPDVDIKSVGSHRKVRKGSAPNAETATMEEWEQEKSQMSEKAEKMFGSLPFFANEETSGDGSLQNAPELSNHTVSPDSFAGEDKEDALAEEAPDMPPVPAGENPLIPPLMKRSNRGR